MRLSVLKRLRKILASDAPNEYKVDMSLSVVDQLISERQEERHFKRTKEWVPAAAGDRVNGIRFTLGDDGKISVTIHANGETNLELSDRRHINKLIELLRQVEVRNF